MQTTVKVKYSARIAEVEPMAKAHEWQKRELSEWNAATFRAYLQDRHKEVFGIPYVAKNIKMEACMMKRIIDGHGPEVLKEFIDTCFSEYRPSAEYPGLNFAFMYSYMRARCLPRILAERRRQQHAEQLRKKLQESHRAFNTPDKSFEEWL